MACPAFTKKVKPGSLGWQVGKRHKDVLVMEEGKTGSHCNGFQLLYVKNSTCTDSMEFT